ncbi:MAG: hypothetical protein AABX64_01635 [Nanoarchaeota archaeon]
MSEERTTQLREQLFQMERKMKPLEWDAGRNQINEFKKQQLERMREEFANLKSELSALEQQ